MPVSIRVRGPRDQPSFVVKGGEGRFFDVVGGQLVVFAPNLVVACRSAALLEETFFVQFVFYAFFGKRGFEALGSAFCFAIG